MKKQSLLIILLFFSSVFCFGQELTVTSVVYDGELGFFDGDGIWPSDAQVKSRWESLFDKYNLVGLESDPFNPNELIQRIGDRAIREVEARTFYYGEPAYTVYVTIGSRRYICFIYRSGLRMTFWYWVYEVR